MKLWLSGEVSGDIGDDFFLAFNDIEPRVNARLANTVLDSTIVEWAWIGLIMGEIGLESPEVKKLHRRQNELELRLKIDHAEFLKARPIRQKQLLIESLERSVGMMADFGVSDNDRAALCQVLTAVNDDCIADYAGREDDLNELKASLVDPSEPDDEPIADESVKLIKFDGTLEYTEARRNGKQVFVHWGNVGDRGEYTQFKMKRSFVFEDFLKEFQEENIQKGFRPVDGDDSLQMIVQFKIEGFGDAEDLEKMHHLEGLFNENLGWTGNGLCDGGDIGSGTMNIFCSILDVDAALKTILETLSKANMDEGVSIGLLVDDD